MLLNKEKGESSYLVYQQHVFSWCKLAKMLLHRILRQCKRWTRKCKRQIYLFSMNFFNKILRCKVRRKMRMNRVVPTSTAEQCSREMTLSSTASCSSSSCSSCKCLISNPNCNCCSSPSAVFSTFCPCAILANTDVRDESSAASISSSSSSNPKSKIFPSTRFFIAILMCFCFISLSISTSNISVSMVCMAPVDRSSNPSSLMSGTTSMERSPAPVDITTLIPYAGFSSDQKLSPAIIKRLKRSSNNTNVFIQEILHVLEKMGVENATFQFSKGNYSSEPTAVVSECQLARFRKHAASPEVEPRNLLSLELGVRKEENKLTVVIESCHERDKLNWTSLDQGIIFSAQNAGSLLMLVTGTQADRLNSKWTIVLALMLLVISNILVPIVAPMGVWFVSYSNRLISDGVSDALLQPSTNSMITRWFPPKERPFAIGFITGGRQIGTLLILPVAGFLCSRKDILNGWPAIYYLSALIGSFILVVWLVMSADKPSKHFCTSHTERYFVEQKIAEENLGKRKLRKKVPWRQLATCPALYAGVAALICHEYPLVIMLQLLPKYIDNVLKLSTFATGMIAALPILVLFISKTISSSLSSLIGARKKVGRFLIERTPLVKLFNGIASLGLGISCGIVPLLYNEDQKILVIVVLCVGCAFAGLHTPGVQTALLQLAPAYTGIVTGIAFGFVAIAGIINKILSFYIVNTGSNEEWSIVFWISSVIALLPVFFFSIWGSADRQAWATTSKGSSDSETIQKAIFQVPQIQMVNSLPDLDLPYNCSTCKTEVNSEKDGMESCPDVFASALQLTGLEGQQESEENDTRKSKEDALGKRTGVV
uniref:Major facilitator superfamily (MFS) profile domain-containing protein n=1 Tax=Ditylenchus dipsaci TaxID=166011 RepID=A0A915EI80_9BILA